MSETMLWKWGVMVIFQYDWYKAVYGIIDDDSSNYSSVRVIQPKMNSMSIPYVGDKPRHVWCRPKFASSAL